MFTTNTQMKISFYFKSSQSSNLKASGFGFIYYYIMVDGVKSKEKSTKIKCLFEEWDANRDCFVGFEEDYRNSKLHEVKNIIEKNKQIKELLGEAVSTELVELHKVDERTKRTFVSVIDEYMSEQYKIIRKPLQLKHKGNIEASTYGTYETRRQNILEYLKQVKRPKMLLSQVDEKFCSQIDIWFTSHKCCGQAYSTKHLKFIRTVAEFGRRGKIIKVNFAKDYKLKTEAKKKVKTLQPADYEKLNEQRNLLTEKERKYIDVFLFMRETLLNVGDYKELSATEHLQIDSSGRYWIVKPRKKRQEENRQIQTIPLSKLAVEIMQQFGGLDNMPKMSRSTLNQYIKSSFAKVGVEKRVSSKLGRSSGISIGFNKRRLRGEVIAFVAGWTSTRELEDYLEVDLDDLSKDYLKE